MTVVHGYELTADEAFTVEVFVTISRGEMAASDHAYWLGLARVEEDYREWLAMRLASDERPLTWSDYQADRADAAAS